jgi:hypothetical protein
MDLEEENENHDTINASNIPTNNGIKRTLNENSPTQTNHSNTTSQKSTSTSPQMPAQKRTKLKMQPIQQEWTTSPHFPILKTKIR